MQRFNNHLKAIINAISEEELPEIVKFNLTQKLQNIIARVGSVVVPKADNEDQSIEDAKELEKIAAFIESHEIKLPEINPELELNTGVDLFLVEYVRLMDELDALKVETVGKTS